MVRIVEQSFLDLTARNGMKASAVFSRFALSKKKTCKKPKALL